MVDFLKANPSITMEEYKWKLSIPMIRLMSSDFTHVKYLSDEEIAKRDARYITSPEQLLNDLNIPVFGSLTK